MADSQSAYGADEDVVTWTIWTNSAAAALSFLTYGLIVSRGERRRIGRSPPRCLIILAYRTS